VKTNRDFEDPLSDFAASRVRFLIVGAYALVFYGRPRATGDLDVWVDPTPPNAARVFEALRKFGAPLDRLVPADFEKKGIVFQIGVEPSRIDVLTSLTGLEFSRAWTRRKHARFGSQRVGVLAPRDFLRNKRALGRKKDLADVEELERGKRRVGKRARGTRRKRGT
jgi:hypothetical protein